MLLWFRNDLRTHDNPALHFFLSEVSAQELLSSDMPHKAVFFISEKQWLEHHWSPIKIDLIKRHAYSLVEELAQVNIKLEIVEVPDFSAQTTYLSEYCDVNNISHVIANSEVEINEQQRDKTCVELGIPLKLFEADVILCERACF